jgi:hypothetical protein
MAGTLYPQLDCNSAVQQLLPMTPMPMLALDILLPRPYI